MRARFWSTTLRPSGCGNLRKPRSKPVTINFQAKTLMRKSRQRERRGMSRLENVKTANRRDGNKRQHGFPPDSDAGIDDVGEHDAIHKYCLRGVQAKDSTYVSRQQLASRANKERTGVCGHSVRQSLQRWLVMGRAGGEPVKNFDALNLAAKTVCVLIRCGVGDNQNARSTSETVSTQPPIAALPNRTTLTSARPPAEHVWTIVSTYACTRNGTAEPVEEECHMTWLPSINGSQPAAPSRSASPQGRALPVMLMPLSARLKSRFCLSALSAEQPQLFNSALSRSWPQWR
jgi:hypothetical protein